MAEVVLRGVRKSFGGREVIHGIDIDARDGELTVLVGPSGCGKSTLLRLIAGLDDVTEGEVLIDGARVNDVLPAKRAIAMVFQSYALYPHMTAYDNMGFGLSLRKYDKREIDRRVRDAARILQIEHLLDRKPKELSGGQRQRVAMGRAIVREPKVFLFDEPLSNLDAALRVRMRMEIARLKSDLEATMVYVTHDQAEAMILADKIIVLRDGSVEQEGAPLDVYLRPKNLFVAGFIGSPSMNFIATEIAALGDGQATVTLPGVGPAAVPVDPEGARVGDKVTLGVRPEHLVLDGGAEVHLDGEVFVVERLGAETYLYVRSAGARPLVVKADGDVSTGIGEAVRVGVPLGACHLFDADGVAFGRREAG